MALEFAASPVIAAIPPAAGLRSTQFPSNEQSHWIGSSFFGTRAPYRGPTPLQASNARGSLFRPSPALLLATPPCARARNPQSGTSAPAAASASASAASSAAAASSSNGASTLVKGAAVRSSRLDPLLVPSEPVTSSSAFADGEPPSAPSENAISGASSADAPRSLRSSSPTREPARPGLIERCFGPGTAPSVAEAASSLLVPLAEHAVSNWALPSGTSGGRSGSEARVRRAKRAAQNLEEEKLREERRRELSALVEQLEAIREHAMELEMCNQHHLDLSSPRYRESARNLLHYMALRNMDVRHLQQALANLGLSSLGRTEAHTLASIHAVTRVVRSMLRELSPNDTSSSSASASASSASSTSSPASASTSIKSRANSRNLASQVEALATDVLPPVLDFADGDRQLQRNTVDLLGAHPPHRKTFIMVTLPAEAAADRALVAELLRAGMNVARVNCAHDDPVVWGRIVANVRKLSAQLGRPCRVLMDLAGPKLRTGPMPAGPRVLRLKPNKDARGKAVSPLRALLFPAAPSASSSSPSATTIPQPSAAAMAAPAAASAAAAAASLPAIPLQASAKWFQEVQTGDVLTMRDACDKRRSLLVTDVLPGAKGPQLIVECPKSVTFETGLPVSVERAESKNGVKGKKARKAEKGAAGAAAGAAAGRGAAEACIGELAATEVAIELAVGDELLIVRGEGEGSKAQYDAVTGALVRPAAVSCSLEQVFTNLKEGEPVKLDDGKIEGVVEAVGIEEVRVRICKTPPGGAKLKSEKAMNLPDSDLQLQGLTAKDIADLDFIVAHADMVAFSFVNDASDVTMLQEELAKRGADDLGVVLKIETKRAFQNLPWLMLQGMRGSGPLGVMIARGDMAVECGWERLAEVQEEVLWLCEAAHVPTIWATQVRAPAASAAASAASTDTQCPKSCILSTTHSLQPIDVVPLVPLSPFCPHSHPKLVLLPLFHTHHFAQNPPPLFSTPTHPSPLQVLEGLAKTGLPSRAEITDAAMGERAECVMLNKGLHIAAAVTTLDDILQRMRSHQMKKQSMMRPLQLSMPFVTISYSSASSDSSSDSSSDEEA
ncbi:unnamed protein product [Closterium sp. NIES-53]